MDKQEKQFFLGIFFVILSTIASMVHFSEAQSSLEIRSIIGPTQASGAADVTISAAGAGRRNCLTELFFVSDGTFTVLVQDGSTNIFQTVQNGTTSFNKSWPIQNALCGTANTAMTIDLSTDGRRGLTGIAAARDSLNYQGFTY